MNDEAPPQAGGNPWKTALICAGLVCALAIAGLMGWLAALGGRLDLSSGPLSLSLAVLALGPLGFYALSLERGKAAPALRLAPAPWFLFAGVYFCVQLSGGIASPLWGAYPLLALVVARNAGALPGVLIVGFATLLESFPLWMQAHGSDFVGAPTASGPDAWPRSLALLFPALGLALGALSRGRRPVWSKPTSGAASMLEVPVSSGASSPTSAPRATRPTTVPGDHPLTQDPGSGDQSLPLAASAALPELAGLRARNLESVLDLAFHAHPTWNALTLWWGDAQGVSLRQVRIRKGRVLATARVEPGQGLLGLAVRDRKAFGAEPLSAAAAACLPYAEQPYQAGVLRIVPLEDEGSLVGLLACDKISTDAFSPGETAALDALARMVIGQAQASAHLERRLASEARTIRLYEAAKALAKGLDRDELLQRFGGLLQSLVPCDSWALGMREEAGAALERVAGQGYREDAPKALSLDRAAALAATLEQADGAVLFNGSAGAQVPAVFLEGLSGRPEHFLLAPLRTGGRQTGVLKVDRAGAPFSEEERDAVYIFANQAAVTLEHARLYSLNQRLATTDGLTGLYNHRYFQERLAVELQAAHRTGRPLSLALGDIDFFKKFNDTFGHQEGDVVLRKVSALLRDGVRSGQDIVCRYGGEEFVAILPDCDRVEARQRIEALRADCAARLSGGVGERAQPITLSLGLSTYPHDAREQRDLIHAADEALYKAKHDGRNRVCAFRDA